MASLNSLLNAMQRSSNKSSGWGSSSHTWGGKTTSTLPSFGKKTSSSQGIANSIMANAKVKSSKGNQSALGAILGGVADTTGNFVNDVVSTAENVPTGLYKIATTNPVDTAKAIGHDYQARYGKLFGGDFSGFAHQLEQHPLSYMLDAATLGTSVAGVAARAGVLSKELSTTGLSLDRAATSAGESARVPVNLSRNPLTRTIQRGVYGVQSKLPQNIPVIGENAAAARSLGTAFQHEKANVFADAKNPAQGELFPREAGSHPPGAQAAISDLRQQYKTRFGKPADKALNRFNTVIKPGGVFGKSTQVWKDLVLAGRPAFQVNNYVGNQAMYHLANGVFGGSKSLTMAAKGDLNTAANKWFSGDLHSLGSTEQAQGDSLLRRVINKSYNVQGAHETLLRKATMRQAAMGIPEVKTLVHQFVGAGKGAGIPMSEGEALSKALDQVLAGPDGQMVRRAISQKIDDTMGNYTHYAAAEQRLKKLVPFYGWNRHSSRFLYATARDKPGVMLGLHQVSQLGAQEHAAQGYNGTPDFMKGYLDIAGHTIDTAPLNPLKGGTDTLKSVRELVSGNPYTTGTDLSSNLNPFASSAIQAFSGKNLLTGAPIPRTSRGLIGSVLEQTVTGLPQAKLLAAGTPESIKSLVGAGPPDKSNPHTFLTATGQLKAKFKDPVTGKVTLDAQGYPVEAPGRHMLNRGFQSLLATFLGVPDRGQVNKAVAQTVQKKINTSNSSGFRPRKKAKNHANFKAVINTQRSSGWGAGQTKWGG